MSAVDTTSLVLVVVVLIVGAWYLSFSASRLDRLHQRVEGSRDALDAQLVRRCAVTLQLATSGLLDPATGLLLADAATTARIIDPADLGSAREVAESNLSRALRAALDQPEVLATLRADPDGADLVAELASACRRVELSRRFHNDAVRAIRAVRRHWAVRWLRLAGHAPLPSTVEIDDTPPAGMTH